MITVRQWFRQLRAADFARELAMVETDRPLGTWTLFDTQTIVDRVVTRAAYAKPPRLVGSLFGMPLYESAALRRGEVWIVPQRWPGLEIHGLQLTALPETRRRELVEGSWDVAPTLHGVQAGEDLPPTMRPDYLGIDRGPAPSFTAPFQPETPLGLPAPFPGTYGAIERSTEPWPWRERSRAMQFTADDIARVCGRAPASLYTARSVTQGLGGPFKVTGGPFASEQTMGWHITDERGFTVAISCDAEFVKRVLSLRGDPASPGEDGA